MKPDEKNPQPSRRDALGWMGAGLAATPVLVAQSASAQAASAPAKAQRIAKQNP